MERGYRPTAYKAAGLTCAQYCAQNGHKCLQAALSSCAQRFNEASYSNDSDWDLGAKSQFLGNFADCLLSSRSMVRIHQGASVVAMGFSES